MKLHLPHALRSAVLACMATFGVFATTIGSGFVTGGAFTLAFMAQEAQAESGNFGDATYDRDFTIGTGETVNLNSGSAQTVNGTVTLNGGTLTSDAGGENNAKTIKKLTGSGYIKDTSWNKLWTIQELTGEDCNIEWNPYGTHFTPSVMYIEGGTYTGNFVFRKTGGGNNNGPYQAILQINQGAIDTFAGASLELVGTDSSQNIASLALNVNGETISLKRLIGNEYSYVYAGSAPTSSHVTSTEPIGSETATLKIIEAGGTFSGKIAQNVTLLVEGGTQTLASGIINGTVKVGEKGALVLNGVTLNKAITLSGGSLNISEGITIGDGIVGVSNDGVISYEMFSGTGSITGVSSEMTSDELKALFNINSLSTLDKISSTWGYADGVLSITRTSESLTWSGGDLTWIEDGTCRMDGEKVFESGDSVTFLHGADEVTVAGEVLVGQITVGEGAELTLRGGEDGLLSIIAFDNKGKLVLEDITVQATGNNVDLNGNIDIFGTVILDGEPDPNNDSGGTYQLSIADDAEWHLTAGSALKRETMGAMHVKGTLSVDEDAEASIISVDDVHVNYGSDMGGKIVLGAGSTLNVDVRKLLLYNSSTLELGADSTLNLKAQNVSGNYEMQSGSTLHIHTTAGESSVNVLNAAAGELNLTIENSTLGVNTTKLASLAGNGMFSKIGDAELTIDSDVELSSFTGGFNATGGTLNLAVSTKVSKLSFVGSGSATMNVVTGSSISSRQVLLGDTVSTTLNIQSGAALNVTGEATIGYGTNPEYKSLCTFLLNHYSCSTSVNVDGSFNMLSNPYLSTVKTEQTVEINVNAGGVYNADGIILVDRDSGNGNATFNLKSGATLNLGYSGLAASNVNRHLSPISRDGLAFNVEAGATIGILDGVKEWSTERNLSWTGNVTLNTQGYKIAENGIGGTREGGSEGTIKLNGTVSGGIIKDGIGNLVLGNTATLSSLEVKAGTVSIDSPATIESLKMSTGSALGFALTDAALVPLTLAAIAAESSALDLSVTATSAGEYTVIAKTGSWDGLEDANIGNIVYDLERGYSATHTIRDGNLVITISGMAAIGDLTWNADVNDEWSQDSEDKNWTIGEEPDSTSFCKGDNVTFATSDTVTIVGEVHAGDVSVAAAGVEWSGSGSVTADSVSIAENATLRIFNTGANSLGAIELAANSSLAFGADETDASKIVADFFATSVTATGTATLRVQNCELYWNTAIGGDNANVSLVVGDDAVMTLATRNTKITNTTIEDGGHLIINSSGDGSGAIICGTATVKKGGVLEMAAGDVPGWSTDEALRLNTLDILGELRISNGTQTAVKMAVNLTGGQITGSSDHALELFTEEGSTNPGAAYIHAKSAADATAEAPTISAIGGVRLGLRQNDSRVIVDNNAELHISSVVADKRNNSETGEGGNHNLLKQGAGKLVLSAVNIYSGETFVEAGVLELQGDGTLGSGAVKISTASETGTPALVFASDKEVEHANVIKGAGEIKHSGTGTTTLSRLSDEWLGTMSVQKGTLRVSTGMSDAGRTISLAQGATLDNTLTLSGGVLELDVRNLTENGTTNATASLNSNTLVFAETDGKRVLSTLNLTMLGTEMTGDTITLLSNVGTLNGCAVGQDGEIGALANVFSVGAITILPADGIQTAAATDAEELLKSRLENSTLYYKDNALYLSLAASKYDISPLYWEPGADGNGKWSGNSWYTADVDSGSAADPGELVSPWPTEKDAPSVYFTGDGDATTPAQVTVDTAAVVTNMFVANGCYSFQQGVDENQQSTGSLEIQGTLTIGDATDATKSASATFDMEATVKDIVLTGPQSTLTVNEELDITGKLTATNGGTITNGLVDTDDVPTTMVLKGAVLGGPKDGGVKLVGTEYQSVVNPGSPGEMPVFEKSFSGFELEDCMLTGQVDNSQCTLQLRNSVTLDIEGMEQCGLLEDVVITYYEQDGMTVVRGGVKNGYTKEGMKAKLFTSGGINAVTDDPVDDFVWMMVQDNGASVMASVTEILSDTGESEGYYSIATRDTGTEYVAGDSTTAVIYDKDEALFRERASALVLDGGSIVLSTGLDKGEGSKLTGGIRAEADGSVTISDGVTLDKADLDANGNTVTLLGGGIYDLADETTLGTGVELGADDTTTTDPEPTWTGTVSTAAISISDINALGNMNSTVELTNAVTGSGAMQADAVGTTRFKQGLTLEKDAFLAANALELESLTLKYLNPGDEAAIVSAAELLNKSLAITIEDSVLATLQQGDVCNLVYVSEDDSLASLSLNGEADGTYGLPGAKYLYTIGWAAPVEEDAATVLADDTSANEGLPSDGNVVGGNIVVLTTTQNPNYVQEKLAPKEPNAQAGAELLDDAFVTLDPQNNAPDSDMAAIMDAVDAGAMTDKDLAAVAGASIATMGMALSGDVERQLSAIRNRTTSMGVNECVVNEGMPYFNAWVNAEGNRAELDKDGTDAGYKLDSWGGTVGFDVDLNPNLTMGMALTAMYGDLTADGPETKAEGDMDTYYVSLFARYASCAWTHTFVATVGMMDGSLDRTVNVGGRTYDTKGSTDGVTFGLLYEVGYVVPLDEDATACLQPVFNVMLRHTSIGSYTEEGSDAALDVDSQSMTTLTFGLGARMQAVVGESLYNRASIFEARALAKVDLGDRRSETDVAFVGGGRSAEIRSAELGAFGVELGAGLTIPLGDDDGSLFVDGAVELQSGYTNVNATVGYRINF